MFDGNYIEAKDRPQPPDDTGRIFPEHVVIACILIATVCVGMGAVGHLLNFW